LLGPHTAPDVPRPHPGTNSDCAVARRPENEALAGVSPEASLVCSNADTVVQSVLHRVRAAGPADIRLVVCDLSAARFIDLAGARMSHALHRELAARGAGATHCGAWMGASTRCEPTAVATKSGVLAELSPSTTY